MPAEKPWIASVILNPDLGPAFFGPFTTALAATGFLADRYHHEYPENVYRLISVSDVEDEEDEDEDEDEDVEVGSLEDAPVTMDESRPCLRCGFPVIWTDSTRSAVRAVAARDLPCDGGIPHL
jgi:hypothetical protein